MYGSKIAHAGTNEAREKQNDKFAQEFEAQTETGKRFPV
jgi:hypothetical protein